MCGGGEVGQQFPLRLNLGQTTPTTAGEEERTAHSDTVRLSSRLRDVRWDPGLGLKFFFPSYGPVPVMFYK